MIDLDRPKDEDIVFTSCVFVGLDVCFVNDARNEAVVVQWTLFFISAVACSLVGIVRGVVCCYFLVVLGDDGFHVFRATVANFNVVFVE